MPFVQTFGFHSDNFIKPPGVLSKELEQHKAQKNRQRLWLLTLVREDKELLITTAVLGLFIAAVSMAMTVFSQRLIDHILPGKNNVKILGGIALVAFLLAVRGYDRPTRA